MGKITGFMEFQRQEESYLAPEARLKNHKEFVIHLTNDQAKVQGARCMDCGIPFCNSGCPVNNIIPDWNDLVYRGHYREALNVLHSTNNFPEFTGRICPAPCESACTLGIHELPVGIKSIEHKIIDEGWEHGWVVPQPATTRPARKWPWSVPVRLAWRRRSSWRAPATPSPCSRNPTGSAACCATGSPTSSWRSTTSTAASSRCRPKA